MRSIGGYTAGARWTNGLVYATDFTDPEVVWDGADTYNFDRPGDAIAYFSGHGTCNDQTDTLCFSTAGCPDIAGVEKRCLRFGEFPIVYGKCVYSYPRSIVGDRTGSSCESVDYSTDGFRWAEDPSAATSPVAGDHGRLNPRARYKRSAIPP